MSMFDPFDEMDKHANRFVAVAQLAKPGMAREQIVCGAVVTFSPNKGTGDRSYTGSIWEVLAFNAGAVVLRRRGGDKMFHDEPIILLPHEHEFYPAEHLLAALETGGEP